MKTIIHHCGLGANKCSRTILSLAILLVLFNSCNTNLPGAPPLFSLLDNTGINFQNTVIDSESDNSFLFRNFYNGGGVATGDLNNDGLADIVFSSNMEQNKIFLNKGNFKFIDITARSGMQQDSLWSTGITLADVNHDGWLDMYICSSGHIKDGRHVNKLYINNHDLSFTESAAQYGLNISGYCTQASFFDYDLDGDLDCFIINNSPIPFSSLAYGNMRDTDIAQWKVAENLKGGGNHLLRNDDGHFVEVTKSAGLHSGLISFGLGVSVGDINGDGYPDIYVGNDFIERDYLYINQKNGRFKDELVDRIQKTSMSSMSSDLGDINNDGYPDIFTTDMIPDDDYRLKTTGTFDNVELYNSKQRQGLHHQFVKNCLQLNNQNGSFLEIGNYAGVSGTDWSWGAVFLDADNDGNIDLFVCNGINRDVGDLDFLDYFSNDVYKKMMETGKRQKINELLQHIPSTPLANRVFQNNGHLNFTDAGKAWGFEKPSFSNSVAYADLDNDGDLDLVINNENQPAFVYRNNSREQNRHHFIGVNLKGRGENTFAVGAKIKLYRGAEVLSREVVPSRGFQSSVEYKQLIGLGTSAVVDSMVVIWPDRTCSRFLHPAIDTVHQLQQPEKPGALYNFETVPLAKTLLESVPNNMEPHRENDYVDFYAERNLPAMLSREGPRLGREDVNGDGLEDFYIGGAKGQAGQLYLQTLQGTFIKKPCAAFEQYKDFEDVAVLFFDADKDGDQDLFVGAGGNESSLGSRELQHRLYKNDGKGNFTIDTKAFTTNSNNISTAAAYDFDGDGDLDLFVGSRSVPFAYGITPESYLYKNDGQGHFTDIAPKLNAQLSQAGMVIAALWADVVGDNKKELILTGEWMAPKIFAYKNGKMELLQNTGLNDLYGWWQSVSAADLNGDGLQDLILGNIGENFYLHPDKNKPVKLWLNDFDGNGSAEGFLTRRVVGKDMPVFLKREVTDQFPALKKQNLRHSSYAIKTVQELFAPELTQKATVKTFNYCSSIVALNNGHGGFTISPLPAQAQLSSVGAVCSTDLNGDYFPDLIIGGNLYNFQPQFGRLDGSCGLVLLNDGKAKFTALPPQQSGLNLKGEVKAIAEITSKGHQQIIVLQNNLQPQVFQIK